MQTLSGTINLYYAKLGFLICLLFLFFLQILTKMDQHDEQSRKLERIHQALDPAYKKYSFSNIELNCFQNIYIYTYIY